jgi:hypothetical protein
MDQSSFTAVTRALAGLPSRRDVLRSLAGAGLGLGALGLPRVTEAKKKHKKKKGKKKGKQQPGPQSGPQSQPQPQPQPLPPLVFNQYGCIAVDQPCRGDSALCCSGICQGSAPSEGQPDDSRCVAHGAGTCKQEGEGICTAANPAGLKCNNNVNCACIQTTAGSKFCYDGVANQSDTYCAECSKDADCEALSYPAGSACAPVSTGICAGICATGMTCLVPCGTAPPGP